MPLASSYPEANEEDLEGIREAEAMLASVRHGYQSARKMLDAALGAEGMARPHAA